ncbi:hypothetical protein RJT34_24741 [Clitoria ternatea]|uniref:Uncharacterized protein n=1 Tax=Clitoria ternatea TaxID=43366 RepID=A0AAN9II99_CLITE
MKVVGSTIGASRNPMNLVRQVKLFNLGFDKKLRNASLIQVKHFSTPHSTPFLAARVLAQLLSSRFSLFLKSRFLLLLLS